MKVKTGQLRAKAGHTRADVRVDRKCRGKDLWSVVDLRREALDDQDDNDYMTETQILSEFPVLIRSRER